MKKERINKAISQINDDFIAEADEPVKIRKFNAAKYLPIAACFAVAMIVAVSFSNVNKGDLPNSYPPLYGEEQITSSPGVDSPDSGNTMIPVTGSASGEIQESAVPEDVKPTYGYYGDGFVTVDPSIFVSGTSASTVNPTFGILGNLNGWQNDGKDDVECTEDSGVSQQPTPTLTPTLTPTTTPSITPSPTYGVMPPPTPFVQNDKQ